jgi:hypothetical protein
MSVTISSADEFKAASERSNALADCEEGTPEAAESAELAAAMGKWERAQQALGDVGPE